MKIEVYSPTIRRKEMDAVLTAMVEDRIGPGERARNLLLIAKEYLHFDYALSLRSPAIALKLALKALNPEKGQGVLISALSPRYYTDVINDMDLCPLYCDVSLTFPCINRETIEAVLAENRSEAGVLCIVLHHTLGYVPDAASIAELGLPVIEDISCSFAVPPAAEKPDNNKDETAVSKERSNEKRADDTRNQDARYHGVFTILGLEERDMLTAGGGALLFAHNRKDSSALRNFSGLSPEFCLPDINAALAAVQFKESRRNMEKRNALAQVYIQASLRTHHKRFIPLENFEYNNYMFSLVLEAGLKDVFAYARKKDIILESAFENTIIGVSGAEILKCPIAYSLSLRTVLFPLYPRLRVVEAERVSKLIAALP